MNLIEVAPKKPPPLLRGIEVIDLLGSAFLIV
jgi:hypothetical protein